MEDKFSNYWKGFLSSPFDSPLFLLNRESLNRFLGIYFKPEAFGLWEGFFRSFCNLSRYKIEALRLAGFELSPGLGASLVKPGEEEPEPPSESPFGNYFSNSLLSGEYRILNLEEKRIPFRNCRGEELPGEGYTIYGKLLKVFLNSETASELLPKPEEAKTEAEAGE